MPSSNRKRRRSSSRDDEDLPDAERKSNDKNTKVVARRPNPFQQLLHINDNDNDEQTKSTIESKNDNDTFALVIEFLGLTRTQRRTPSSALPSSSTPSNTEKDIPALARQLFKRLVQERQSPSLQGSLISAADIANLLLPWAIKTVIRSSAPLQDLEWEILEECTQLFLDYQRAASVTQEFSGHFSLSNLHKLVPLAAAASVVSADTTTVSIQQEKAGTCYCLWVEHLYRPPFDKVCLSLVPPIGEMARRRFQEKEGSPAETHVHRSLPLSDKMTRATMNLLKQTLEKANPKKAFLTLIQPHIMIALSEIYTTSVGKDMMHELIDGGIFHASHHLDGFRSIQMQIPTLYYLAQTDDTDRMEMDEERTSSTKSSFQCYQQGLMTMIQASFAPSVSNVSAAGAIARLVPILFESFICQSNEILKPQSKTKESVGKKKATAKKIGQMQMAFFANLTEPILTFVCSSTSRQNELSWSISCDALYQCTNLLLQYDVYLPSNDDEGDKNFGYLRGLSRALMGLSISSSTDALSVKTFPILASILRLNHLAFHDILSETMASCLTGDGGQEGDGTPVEVVRFFCQMIVTYKQLRQLDYLCTAVKNTAVQLSRDEQPRRLRSFFGLTECEEVVKAFGDAVQSSPMQQIKLIVVDYNSWLVSRTEDAHSASQASSIKIMVAIFCLLLKTVRVDAASAQELSPLCTEIASGAVQALVPEESSLESLGGPVNQGILLCAWVLDLSNRCNFWLRNSQEIGTDDEFGLPANVQSILTEGIDGISKTSNIDFHGALEYIQLLACHRLEQLHGRIQEKQRVSFASDIEEFNIELEVQETKETSNFALKALQQEQVGSCEFNRLWDNLAVVIGSWAPYVENDIMRWYLRCFCSRPSADGNDSSSLWLLRDASFFETPKILENFGPSALGQIARVLHNVLSNTSTKDEKLLSEMLCTPDSTSWTSLTPEKLSRTVSVKIESIKGSDLEQLAGSLRVLKVINGIQNTAESAFNDQASWFETCVCLDFVCAALAQQTGFENNLVLIQLVAELRYGLAAFASKSLEKESGLHSAILLYLFRSTISIVEKGGYKTRAFQNLLDSTKQVIARMCTINEDLTMFQDVVKEYYRAGDDNKRRNRENFVLTSLAASIAAELPLTQGNQYLVETIRRSVWPYVTKSIGDPSDNNSAFEGRASCLFMSEILRRGGQTGVVELFEKPILHALQSMKENSEGHWRNLAYLIACYATAGPSRKTRLVLFDALTGEISAKLPDIIQDALAQILLSMDADELRSCLEKLTDGEYSSGRLPPHLRLFRLLLLNSPSEECNLVLSKSAQKFFSMALSSMTAPRNRNSIIGDSVALIQEIASNRSIMSIRERQLALILSRVVAAMQVPPKDSPGMSVTPEVFNASFSLVSFVLQRFSKQLHNCIPSVVNCLSVILGRCLHDELSDLEAIERGHKFSRLAELLLPHGDIYKKHVLSLIVAFVQALKRQMNPVLKNSLSPAVYCFLDILQQHEITQLNSMLDDMGRAVLRTVHESYKKLHVYKGQ